MAAIGKLNAEYRRVSYDEDGGMEISFAIAPESGWAARQVCRDLKALTQAGKKLVVTIQEHRNRRSLDQNRMLWALLEIMARSLNGGRSGGVTAWDCYLDMLEKYGARFEYLQCTKAAFGALKEMFRAIKIVEERDHDTVMCKAYIGSSQFTTEEMSQLIEGIFDELAMMGVEDDREARYLREEWLRR